MNWNRKIVVISVVMLVLSIEDSVFEKFEVMVVLIVLLVWSFLWMCLKIRMLVLIVILIVRMRLVMLGSVSVVLK